MFTLFLLIVSSVAKESLELEPLQENAAMEIFTTNETEISLSDVTVNEGSPACPDGKVNLPCSFIKSNKNDLCDLVEEYGIYQGAPGCSFNGHGYNCTYMNKDSGGDSLCMPDWDSASSGLYCVKITTGNGVNNDGYLKVTVDTGNGNGLESWFSQALTKDQQISKCFTQPVINVGINNPKDDGWHGSIEYSTDGGGLYNTMECFSGCTGVSPIWVDGLDSAGNEAGGCIGYDTVCILQKIAPPTPAPPTPPTSGPPPGSRRGSFLVIGDWGYDKYSHGNNIKPVCQQNIANAMKAKAEELGDVKFILNMGDSFYPAGIETGHSSEWTTKWLNVYGSLTDLPWFSVYGNHDYEGTDRCSCNYDTSGCAQVNPSISKTSGWFMPNVSYFDTRYLDELHLEIIALDLNAVDYLDSHDGICKYSHCDSMCNKVLKKRKDDALALFSTRITQSKARNLLVFSHYPTDYPDRAGYNNFMSQLRDNSAHNIQYFGGHRHSTEKSWVHIEPNTQWLVGGGGGWSCDSKNQGFVVGEIDWDYNIKTYSKLINYADCCYS